MERTEFINKIEKAFNVHNIVAVLGPRQCGKTTLASAFFHERKGLKENYFDLEDPVDEARIEHPKSALEPLKGLVVIDEVQRKPQLFKTLRVLTDQQKEKTKYLILGSASHHLIRQSSETLAGRIQYIELTPFQLSELGTPQLQQLWLRGGFPPSFLAENDHSSQIWRDAYIRTYLEQDIPSLGINIPSVQLRRFWMMLTHFHGQVFNSSEIAKSLQISDVTARRYLDILSGTFMIRQLQPWQANLKKRQIKRPKIYFRDSGIFHRLLLLDNDEAIRRHPRLGASWEGFALEEAIRFHGAAPENCFFWGIHGQAELDLLLFVGGKKMGFEVKYCDAPTLTPSLRKAKELLELDSLQVIYPGSKKYHLDEGVSAVPLTKF